MQKDLHYPTSGQEGMLSYMAQEARTAAAENLKRWREAHDLSVYALAKLAHVSRNTIDNVELNRNAVTLDTLEALAGAFGQVWELLRPIQPAVPKAVAKIPKPKAATPPSDGTAAELFGSVRRLQGPIRRAERGVVDDALPAGDSRINRPRARPKSRKKVA